MFKVLMKNETENDYEDCLVELPPFGSFPVKNLRKVREPVVTDEDLDAFFPTATVSFEFDVA